jgi:hypothetical protein
MSTPSLGINHYVAKHVSPTHPNATRKFALGDINTTLIKTEKGLTVTLYHDTQTPRPYDLILRVQGTEAIYMMTLDKIYVDGRSPVQKGKPVWEELEPYYAQYEHPLWERFGHTTGKYPHGPIDYMVVQQFIDAVRAKSQPPIDVYDAATWSVISPLTERSVAARSAAVDFPDFTRGKWNTRKPVYA